jgi:dTDP-4-amino-4,6-dideoxygalactose transaminase
MSNICAGIGRGQMQVLNERVKARRAMFDYYKTFFASVPGIRLFDEPQGMFSNRWLSTIVVNPKTAGVTREDIRLALEAQNIESRPLWKPLHLQPIFASSPYYGNRSSEKLFDEGLCLPSGSNLSKAELERINETLNNILKPQKVIALS